MPSASQSPRISSPASGRDLRVAVALVALLVDVGHGGESTVAAGDIVQNAFRPSMRQPAGVRVAVVCGRVRSWLRSLIAAAMITPLAHDVLQPGAEPPRPPLVAGRDGDLPPPHDVEQQDRGAC